MSNYASDASDFLTPVDEIDTLTDTDDSLGSFSMIDDEDYFSRDHIKDDDEDDDDPIILDLDDDDEIDDDDDYIDEDFDLSDVSSDDTVGLYLKEMARVPLLTNEEEISLAKRLEAGRKAENRLAKLNGNATPELVEDLNRLIEDGQAARAHVIKANTRLVVSI
ncbi:MAG TPA: sigma-70 factor domain-containing protein, partial [Aggregatilineales bacterium]|nr:sigma-70 factor domain-containing protein [Aggregatilineales bacterium]